MPSTLEQLTERYRLHASALSNRANCYDELLFMRSAGFVRGRAKRVYWRLSILGFASKSRARLADLDKRRNRKIQNKPELT